MSGRPVQRFVGKYRGTVTQNIDPMLRGRLLCMVPDVLGPVPSSWAEPCVPLAGPTGPPMGVYLVPPIGAGVWVEFEQGDPGKDRKSTRLNSSHIQKSRMPSSA